MSSLGQGIGLEPLGTPVAPQTKKLLDQNFENWSRNYLPHFFELEGPASWNSFP